MSLSPSKFLSGTKSFTTNVASLSTCTWLCSEVTVPVPCCRDHFENCFLKVHISLGIFLTAPKPFYLTSLQQLCPLIWSPECGMHELNAQNTRLTVFFLGLVHMSCRRRGARRGLILDQRHSAIVLFDKKVWVEPVSKLWQKVSQ